MAELEIEKRIEAPVREVFEAVVQPQLIMLWIGPAGAEVSEVVSDPRVGGRFRLRMRDVANNYYAVEGEYLDFEPNHRVVMSWTWVESPEGDGKTRDETRLEFTFEADGEATIIRLTHSGLPNDTVVEDHGKGWGDSLTKLAELLQADPTGR